MQSLRPVLVLLLLLAFSPFAVGAQSPSSELLDAAIAHHDPAGNWSGGGFRFQFNESRPDGPSRETTVAIDNAHGSFAYTTQRDDALIEGELVGDDCTYRLDGSSEITDEQREEHRLTCDRLAWIRNYYAYLWGLPMKLKDEGTVLDPEVTTAEFDGRDALQIRVTYEESVGDDIWYFYFDPQTHALIGYRFYHDEAANDGEYILLEGEVEAAGMKLPKARTWYTHKEDKLLGTDTLLSLQAVAGDRIR